MNLDSVVLDQVQTCHLSVRDRKSGQLLDAEHLGEQGEFKHVAIIRWHELDLRFDLASHQEGCLRGAIVISMHLGQSLDNFVRQVGNLILNGKWCQQLYALNFALITDSN